jgi:alpha-L-fucosidase 2
MLLQSQAGRIDVLPALPSAWPDGSYTGLKARGDVEVDARWEDGSVRQIGIRPAHDGELRIGSELFRPGEFTLTDARGRPVAVTVEDGVATFDAHAGWRYVAATAHRR